jgi:hypothetical protein
MRAGIAAKVRFARRFLCGWACPRQAQPSPGCRQADFTGIGGFMPQTFALCCESR